MFSLVYIHGNGCFDTLELALYIYLQRYSGSVTTQSELLHNVREQFPHLGHLATAALIPHKEL